MSDVAKEFIAAYPSTVQIVQGPHIETVVPENVQHMRSDVLTLDGRIV